MNKAQDYDDNHLSPTESDVESSRCMNTAPNVSMTATLPTIAQGQKPLTANEMLRMPRPTPCESARAGPCAASTGAVPTYPSAAAQRLRPNPVCETTRSGKVGTAMHPMEGKVRLFDDVKM